MIASKTRRGMTASSGEAEMDAQRFDGLVRGLARASTRRDFLRAAASSFASAFLAAIGARPTGAQPGLCAAEGDLCLRPCCRGLRCRDGRCARCQPLGDFCLSGRECCGNAICERDVALGLGRCRCRAGETECNGVCRNLRSDPFACGGCLNQCRLGTETCLEGRCCTSAGQTCPGECPGNQPCPRCCQGFCHSSGIGRRRLFCGCQPGTRQCGDACLPAEQCCTDADCGEGLNCSPQSRRCVGCPPGERDCGGFCVPVDACCRDSECTSAAPFCVAGVCQPCPAGRHYECRTWAHPKPWCDDETYCGCIRDGEFICGPINSCPLGVTCTAYYPLILCPGFYWCD